MTQMISSAKGRLQICHVATGDGWGGAERVVSLLVAGLSKYPNIDLQVVLFNNGQLGRTLVQSNLAIHVIDEQGRSFVSLCRELRRWFSIRKFDVIHVHRYNELAAVLLASFPNVPRIVVTVHGLQPWSQITFIEAVKYWMFMILARYLGAWFVPVSHDIEARLSKVLGRSRLTKIGNPVVQVIGMPSATDIRKVFGWPHTQKVVAFIGRLEYVKGPDLFLEIAKISSRQIGFVLIGSGSMDAELRSTVRSCGEGLTVGFLGQVPDATLLLRQVDVLALTSRHEGLPMVVLEAASLEVPVVAFNVGGVSELVDNSEAAKLVPFGNLSVFASELESTLANRDRVKESLSKWGQSLKVRFDLQSIVQSYAAIYKKIALGN